MEPKSERTIWIRQFGRDPLIFLKLIFHFFHVDTDRFKLLYLFDVVLRAPVAENVKKELFNHNVSTVEPLRIRLPPGQAPTFHHGDQKLNNGTTV